MRIGTNSMLGLLVCGCAAPAYAQDPAPGTRDPETEARALVEDVLAESSADTGRALERELAEWADAIVGNAIPQAGPGPADGSPANGSPANGSPADSGLADGNRADGGPADGSALILGEAGEAGSVRDPVGATGDEAQVIVFMSFSVPEPSWRQWSAEAGRIGAPMVLRGVKPDGFAATARAIRERQPGENAGAAIDPRLFRLFRIGQVPAVAVVPGGVGPCATRGCSADPPPPHDLVTGNIGLEAALEIVAREGDAGREAARRSLAALRGERN